MRFVDNGSILINKILLAFAPVHTTDGKLSDCDSIIFILCVDVRNPTSASRLQNVNKKENRIYIVNFIEAG